MFKKFLALFGFGKKGVKVEVVDTFQPEAVVESLPKAMTAPIRKQRYLPVPINGELYKLYGGPYMQKPEEMRGVKMAMEIKQPCDYDVMTPDFSLPLSEVHVRAAINGVLAGLPKGEEWYVGCMGGIGRTGLFMALVYRRAMHLAKTPVTGMDAVRYVREQYYGHAVETPEQQKYVSTFKIDW